MEKREAVHTLQPTHGVSIARGCAALKFTRSAYYQKRRDWQIHDRAVLDALNPLVEAHPRWGVWKYVTRLRAVGHFWNHKRLYRVYRQLKRNQPRRAKRRLPHRPSLPVFVPEGPNEIWSAGFMRDALYHGLRFRTFNIIDDCNRGALAIEIDTSLRAERIIRVFDRVQVEQTPHTVFSPGAPVGGCGPWGSSKIPLTLEDG